MTDNFGENRPWGKYEILLDEETYKVKRIYVKPKERLSLQYHHHRSEVWVVVQGNAIVTCGKEDIECQKGDYIAIPQKVNHRIKNIGDNELIFIEVQNGSYLGEDDIVRLQDDYDR